MTRILVIGLNPAWQKIYLLGSFNPGGVNRVEKSIQVASGKGINCARVLKKLGHEVTVLQVTGGTTGLDIAGELEEAGIAALTCDSGTGTRTCTTLVSPGREASEIIEPFKLKKDLSGDLARLVREAGKAWDGLIFCGSLPWGLPAHTYSRILDAAGEGFVLLDGFQGFDRKFFDRVTAIKINREEFTSLKDELKDELPGSLEYILVTDGHREAVLYEKISQDRLGVVRRFPVPKLEALNSIGAGDAVMAGFSSYWPVRSGIEDACRRALAMGSASCLTLVPGDYDETEVERLEGQI